MGAGAAPAEDRTRLSRLGDRGAHRIALACGVLLAEGADAGRLGREGHVRGRIAVRVE